MAKQTFEDAMKRLETIVEELEGGELALDEALKKFQEGVKLYSFCTKKLDESEKKVALLLKDDQGELREEPFAPPDDEERG